MVTDITHTTQCDSSDQVTVTIKPLPIAFAAATDTVVTCSSVGINLGTTPETGLNYSWSPANGLSNAQISNPTATLTSIGAVSTTKFKLTVLNDGTTCINYDSVWVKVNPLPEVQLGIQDSLCSGDTIQLGANLVSLNNFLWTPTTGLNSNLIPNPLLSLVNGTQTVQVFPYKLLVRNPATGCADSSTLQVRVNPLPVADAGLDRSICSGETTQIGAATIPGYGYLWIANPSLLNLNTISNPVFSQSIVGDPKKDTLSVIVTNAVSGCKKSDQVIVTTNPRPVPMTFTPYSNAVCPFTPNVNYTVSNSIPGNTYAWQVGGGTLVSGGNTNSISVTWNGTNPSAYVVVTPTNQYTCVGTKDSLAILLTQILKPRKPVGDSVLCSYYKTGKTYTTIPTPGSNYTWKLVGASVDSTVSTDGQTTIDWTQNNGTAKIWIQQQSSTISNTGEPVFCYGQSDTLRVQINPSPDSTLLVNGLSSVCATSNTLGGYTLFGMNGSTYAWTVQPNSPEITAGQGTDSVTVKWSVPGNYTVGVVETSNKGCVGRPRSKPVVVNALPSPGITLSSLKICPNDLDKGYLAQSAPGFVNSTWNWTIEGGTANTATNEAFVGVNWGSGGVYSLRLEETTTEGCKKDTLLPLFYDPSGLTLHNVSLLENDENQVELKFSMASQQTNPSTISLWRKEQDAGSSSWQKIAENIAKNIEEYKDQPGATSTTAYSYKVSGTNVCDKVVESNIHNTILLTANAVQEKETANLYWNEYVGWPQGVASYSSLRKVDNEVDFKTLEEGIAAGTVQRSYVIASDGFKQCFRIVANEKTGEGQSMSNSVCVTFDNPVQFTNFMSPNGDGKNDVWNIYNLHLYPNNELTIFDRWGKKVFDKSNYNDGDLWKAEGIENGTYFYKFSVPDRSLNYSGWINITK